MTSLVYSFALVLVVLTIILVGIVPLFAMAHRDELKESNENEQ